MTSTMPDSAAMRPDAAAIPAPPSSSRAAALHPARARKRSKARGNLFSILVPALLLGAWFLSDLVRPDKFSVFPSLQDVVTCWIDWIFDTTQGRYFYSGTWILDFAASMIRIIGGLVIGSAAAVLFGLSVLWLPIIEKITDPVIQILRPIPKTAFLPFAILLFGLGNGPAMFMTIYGVFLIVYVQVIMSIKLVPADLKHAAAMLGASKSQVVMKPSSLMPDLPPPDSARLKKITNAASVTNIAALRMGGSSG